MDGPGVDDRAYRLMHNAGQNRTDEFAAYGAIGGGLSGLVSGMVPGASSLVRVWRGASVGIAFGVLAHVVTMKPENEKSVREQVREAATKMK